MDGPDPHVMLTGLFRAGLAVKNLLSFLQFVQLEHFLFDKDLSRVQLFSNNVFSGLNVDNAFVKFGQLQLEYQEAKQIWESGMYQ